MKFKKPKFWDQKRPNLYAYSLVPISYLVKLIKFFKKIGIKAKKTKIKTICVGNIYIGGTGKTSLSIRINDILTEQKIKSCFIKKFYTNQIDEQKILANKGKLFLSSKRIDAINQAKNENYEVAILDDGLQDDSIDYDISFICFNNINWIGNGLTIPAGPLRENLNSIKKYQHIFLNGNLENVKDLSEMILDVNPNINIHIGIYEPINLNEFDKKNKYLVFSGIGNHQTFVSMIKKFGLQIYRDIEYPDHYDYKNSDIEEILNEAEESNSKIITTEKDYYRLKKKIDGIKYLN
jgi:tetraacyldisaccharide 4'-kinase